MCPTINCLKSFMLPATSASFCTKSLSAAFRTETQQGHGDSLNRKFDPLSKLGWLTQKLDGCSDLKTFWPVSANVTGGVQAEARP